MPLSPRCPYIKPWAPPSPALMPLTLLLNPPSCPPGLHAGSHCPRAFPRESIDPPHLSPLRPPPTAGCPSTYPLFIGSQGDISKRPVWSCHAPIYSPCSALLCSWAPASICDVPAGPSMIGSCLSHGPSSLLMFCHQLCATCNELLPVSLHFTLSLSTRLSRCYSF